MKISKNLKNYGQVKLIMDNVSTNIEEVYQKFLKLNAGEMNKALKSALVAGAKELKAETISNLDSSILVKGSGMNDLHEGVGVGKVKGDYGEELEIKVNIMGKKLVHGGRDGRLRWLEKGTNNRYAETLNGEKLIKPRFTGKIQGKYFFKSANDSVISKLDNIYTQAIDKAINKINKNK